MALRNPALAAAAAAMLPAGPVAAQSLCPGLTTAGPVGGRMFNHLRYGESDPATLVPAPPSLSPDGACRVHPALIADLARLAAEADRDPAIAGQLRLVSCWRGVAYQAEVFCRDLSEGAAQRAWSSAPPGYSEHATGYAVDFGAANLPGCNLQGCFAASPAGQWLLRNAARFGFEMSFSAGSRQQVSWEPWHWRWVGTTPQAPGAGSARAMFALARGLFPANPAPAEAPLALRLTGQPPNPLAAPSSARAAADQAWRRRQRRR